MCVAVTAADLDAVMLRAPLAPNINHHDTVFGGSASTLATLAAWSLLHVRLAAENRPNRLMIQRNTMEYLQPIHGEFSARAGLDASEWPTFTRMLTRKGKARIAVTSVLECANETVGRFQGEFVAFVA